MTVALRETAGTKGKSKSNKSKITPGKLNSSSTSTSKVFSEYEQKAILKSLNVSDADDENSVTSGDSATKKRADIDDGTD